MIPEKPSKELLGLGRSLIFLSAVAFIYFLTTTKRSIDFNLLFFPFAALMGWFIMHRKAWARMAIMILFSIAAIFDVVAISISLLAFVFNDNLTLLSILPRLFLDILWFGFHGGYVMWFFKESIKRQFIFPKAS